MDNVQKDNYCTNGPLSQTFESYLQDVVMNRSSKNKNVVIFL
jgi:hypothetical protein